MRTSSYARWMRIGEGAGLLRCGGRGFNVNSRSREHRQQEEQPMSEIRIEIPASLGLSDDEVNKLTEAFRNQVVGAVNSTQARTGVQARPQSVVQSRPQSSIKEMSQVVEVRE